MKCGECPKTDGLCYTSNPPKIKCTVTGKFHFYDDECEIVTTEINITKADVGIGVSCMVCNEAVLLTKNEEFLLSHGRSVGSKICDKCKEAILHVRKQLDETQKIKRDYMNIKGLTFIRTCRRCPEQYDVKDSDGNNVGYIRLRFGQLTCEYPDVGGELIYSVNIGKIGWSGEFENDDQRMLYLNNICDIILENISSNK